MCIVAQELLSAYGRGVARCADGLLAGQRALRPAAGRNWPAALAAQLVGAIPSAAFPAPETSRFSALLQAGCAGLEIPADAPIYLATTADAIDELEAAARAVCEPYFTRPLSEI